MGRRKAKASSDASLVAVICSMGVTAGLPIISSCAWGGCVR